MIENPEKSSLPLTPAPRSFDFSTLILTLVLLLFRYVPAFVKAGASQVTVHIETLNNRATESTEELLNSLRGMVGSSCKLGISLKPSTPLTAILPFVPLVDLVLGTTRPESLSPRHITCHLT